LINGLDAQTVGPNADLNGLTGRVNLITWPYTLPEVVPDVQATWELSCGTGPQHTAASYQWALCWMWLPTRLDTRARQGVNHAARHWSSFLRLKLFVLRSGTTKAARNAPKCHYSRLYRAGLFVPVVAQPIQNMSEVSITHKTMGIRLPRLWCGAIGWRTNHPIKFHPAQSWTH
jgi:hypothetical protein